MTEIEIEFDKAKNASNIFKHGVSLTFGLAVLTDPIGQVVDNRHDYGEERINAFGFVEGRLFVCTYTFRGRIRRIISVRRAKPREQLRWLL